VGCSRGAETPGGERKLPEDREGEEEAQDTYTHKERAPNEKERDGEAVAGLGEPVHLSFSLSLLLSDGGTRKFHPSQSEARNLLR
jgi:hypothetical protein